MDQPVFISYSSQDKALADRVCEALEKAGAACWIAPRNIDPGADFPNAIMQAIGTSQVLVVLLTDHAMASPHVLSEIGHAFNEKKLLLPLRLSNLALPADFEYFLSTPQWLDAPSGLTDERLKRLVEAVSEVLAGRAVPTVAPPPSPRKALVIGAAFLVLAIGLAAVGMFRHSGTAANPPNSEVSTSIAPLEHSAGVVAPAVRETSLPKIWVNPKDGEKYVWIAPGSFTMGCSPGDSQCKDDEKPSHLVNIPTGFWLGQTEVTNATYIKVAPTKTPRTKEDPVLPLRGLSWPEAKAYCIATGGRLPTEAEWEYAARGGRPEPFYGVPSKIAWYANNSGQQPHPVGMKEPNAFGLYDMLGNVSEWVLDRYYNKYDLEADAVGQHIDQPLAGNASAVARGGFWDAELSGIRVSHRSEMSNDEGVETAGLRCANDHR